MTYICQEKAFHADFGRNGFHPIVYAFELRSAPAGTGCLGSSQGDSGARIYQNMLIRFHQRIQNYRASEELSVVVERVSETPLTKKGLPRFLKVSRGTIPS